MKAPLPDADYAAEVVALVGWALSKPGRTVLFRRTEGVPWCECTENGRTGTVHALSVEGLENLRSAMEQKWPE